jgi:hypothetical protein
VLGNRDAINYEVHDKSDAYFILDALCPNKEDLDSFLGDLDKQIYDSGLLYKDCIYGRIDILREINGKGSPYRSNRRCLPVVMAVEAAGDIMSKDDENFDPDKEMNKEEEPDPNKTDTPEETSEDPNTSVNPDTPEEEPKPEEGDNTSGSTDTGIVDDDAFASTGSDIDNSGDTLNNNIADPGTVSGGVIDDGMEPIPLDSGPSARSDVMFKKAVVRIYRDLMNSPGPVEMRTLNALKKWCESWIWLASPAATDLVLDRLGLKRLVYKPTPVQEK